MPALDAEHHEHVGGNAGLVVVHPVVHEHVAARVHVLPVGEPCSRSVEMASIIAVSW